MLRHFLLRNSAINPNLNSKSLLSNRGDECVGVCLQPGVHLADRHGCGDDGFVPVLGGNTLQPCIGSAPDVEAALAGVIYADLVAVGAIEALAGQQADAVLDYIICGGIAACALTIEALAAGNLAVQGDQVEVGGHGGLQSALGIQGGLDEGAVDAICLSAVGDQLAGKAMILEIGI